jgi:hypothetical protein
LKNRIYPKDQPFPPDHKNWLQCHNCGEIFPIYEMRNEPVIKDFTEVIYNPFDVDREAVLGIASRQAGRKARKKKELFGDINDPDLKRELASGQTKLLSYTES